MTTHRPPRLPEKRKSPRVDKLYLIAYVPQNDGPQKTQISLGRTLNISPSGVAMEIYREIPLGTALELEIDFDDVTVSAWGKVIRSDDLGGGDFTVAIKFDEQQVQMSARLAALLQQEP
ncbi:MAG: hypothetical protein A2091_08880 [Desulfuromonadales bacterium GWD2_61_12]|nr:MAG: hypothetical protein A2005_00510 [Desulfuromonadales bacterium GWC2_61_20]OGR32800.1 MAG: hypothetical protein A2091_08880 [Desulfuromonadales bacterium GWD2_61_12]HAD04770.1 hypothetical protein [Desulfuromonas sp.]HBT84112.1 hypothetical protein [Desulfuromonas sp.]